MVDGVFEGNIEEVILGGAELLGASSQVVLVVAGAAETGGGLTRLRPKGPNIVVESATRPRVQLTGAQALEEVLPSGNRPRLRKPLRVRSQRKSVSKESQIARNKAQGDEFEDAVFASAIESQRDVVRQVTVKTKTGVKTVLDILGRDRCNTCKITEAKSSAKAPLTGKQKLAFPEIAETGAVVVGKGKPGFPGGTVLPPTVVDIGRPEDLLKRGTNGG